MMRWRARARASARRLHVGFMRRGDTLGVASQLDGTVDYNVMYTSAHVGCTFGVLRRFEFERCLRQSFEKALESDVQLVSRIPSLVSLSPAAVRSLVLNSRSVIQPAGHVLVTEEEPSEEMYVLKSGSVRLFKTTASKSRARWPVPPPLAPAAPGASSGLPPLSARGAASSARARTPASSPRPATASPRGPTYSDPPPRLHTPGVRPHEVTTISYQRVVVAGDVEPGDLFAKDAALAVRTRRPLRGRPRARHGRALALRGGGARRPPHTARSRTGPTCARQVIMRVAAAQSGGKGRAAPIKRNCTAFCITPVQALAISPVTFMQYVQGEQLVQSSSRLEGLLE